MQAPGELLVGHCRRDDTEMAFLEGAGHFPSPKFHIGLLNSIRFDAAESFIPLRIPRYLAR